MSAGIAPSDAKKGSARFGLTRAVRVMMRGYPVVPGVVLALRGVLVMVVPGRALQM